MKSKLFALQKNVWYNKSMGKFTYSQPPLKGFAMEFDNGYAISVQWSSGNYGSNRFKTYESDSASTAEISVYDSNGKQQEPIGWLTTEEVAAKMVEISKIRTKGKWVFDFI